jgi:hypothetical protein
MKEGLLSVLDEIMQPSPAGRELLGAGLELVAAGFMVAV